MAAVEMTDMTVLYRGYSSKIAVGVTNSGDSKIKLRCTNCDTLYKVRPNEYIIKPGNDREAKLQVLLEDGDSIRVAKQIKYKVRVLPHPILYWGSAREGNKGVKSARLLRALYPPEIPLRASFVILKWSITINCETAAGVGGNLKN
ncbi:MAG: hypothetical protein HRT57_16530, partial [Crocinitomicaceae bacterium]|nr:hypothetical protein [Crocinitomicaceae bacterium]